jgi:hypothetical protein
MSIRYAIADFISGGELTFQRRGWERSRSLNLDWQMQCQEAYAINARTSHALRKVIEQETDGANATVKRMANIAREGLK